jgi:lambda family phage portal protein
MAGFMERAVDGVIAVFAPKAALMRRGARNALSVQNDGQALLAAMRMESRKYAAASRDRFTGGWRANGSSGNANLQPDLALIRARTRGMERDNPYITAATRNLTVDLTGLDMRATHENPRLAKKAQQAWNRFKKKTKFHIRQKVVVRETITGGEALIVWRPKGNLPNQRMQVLAGDHLDTSKTEILANGNRIVMGVEFDSEDGDPVAYWIFPEHPGDLVTRKIAWVSERIDARYVDHVFEELWPQQARGVPWFYGSVLTFDEIAQLETAMQVKKRVEACVTVFRTPGTDPNAGSDDPIGARKREADGRMLEEVAPGMILHGNVGDKFEIVNPSSNGDGGDFLRAQLMKGCAGIGVPYHMVTGDVTKANFSSLRADLIPYRARREDWAYTVFTPKGIEPAFRRCMELEAAITGDQRYLDVIGEESLPPMEWIDPLKDIMALKEKLRIFPGMLPETLAKLGLDWRVQVDTQSEVDQYVDLKNVTYDADARRVNGAGALQTVKAGETPTDAGAQAQAAINERTTEFALRIWDALDERDGASLNLAFAEAAQAVRSGDPAAAGMHAVLMALTER